MQQNMRGPSIRQVLTKLVKNTMSSLVPVWITEMTSSDSLLHQGVAYVTKLLNTEEALATESGQRLRVQEYFKLREKMVRPPVKIDSIAQCSECQIDGLSNKRGSVAGATLSVTKESSTCGSFT